MTETKSRAIVRTVTGEPTSDGAGVRLTRILGGAAFETFDPFLLLDEFRSDDPSAYIAGFPPHPHRGFETVTYMLHGTMQHEDSTGTKGVLTSGSVQWMTAGRGIIHSEMPGQTDGLLWGYQLWINLPAALKMSPPRYQDIPAERIPESADAQCTVRVIAGSHGTLAGAAETLIPGTYLDVRLAAGTDFTAALGEGANAFAYVYDGAVVGRDTVGREVRAERGVMAVLSAEGAVALSAGEAGARFLLIAGAALNEPVARYGPFVMNNREELAQAVEDYQRGTFAGPSAGPGGGR